jgi:hypothetical protein
LDTLQTEVINHSGHWTDAAWQAQLQTQLAAYKIDAVLQNASSEEIFRSKKNMPPIPYRRLVLIENRQITKCSSARRT